MSIYRRKDSPFWQYDFTIQGRRFRGSAETDDKTAAEAIVARRRAEILLEATVGLKPRLTLDAALGQFWIEVGHAYANADLVKAASRRLNERIGKGRYIDEISAALVADYVAWRRGHQVPNPGSRGPRLISNATVNRDIGVLRSMMIRADKIWHVRMPKDQIHWKSIMLPEADDTSVILTYEAEEKFFAVLRPDYRPLFLFAILSKLRKGNLINLRWAEVDFDNRSIVLRAKSRRPGGKLLVIPITDAMMAILSSQRGQHDEFVFTYQVHLSRRDPRSGLLRVKGQRYKFSRNGWKKEFYRARRAAGIPNLRFHDLRHTGATRFARATGDVEALRKLLGHTDIRTTMRYMKYVTADLRALMERADEATAASRIRHAAVADQPQEIDLKKKNG